MSIFASRVASGETPVVQNSKECFEIYGFPHSPFVQAVLMALHAGDRPHRLTLLPWWNTFRRFGVLMPILRDADGVHLRESEQILERLGHSSLTDEERTHLGTAWRGVLHRPDSIRKFLTAFSRTGDPDPVRVRGLLKDFLRAFVGLYFLVLIRSAVRRIGYSDPDDFYEGFHYWEERLASQRFLAGDDPDSADFMLLGVIECHASVPVPPMRTIVEDPRLGNLRGWIERMHSALPAYPYFYSAMHLESGARKPEAASLVSRAAFFSGALVMVAAFPLTLAVIIYFMRARQKFLTQY